MRLSVLLAASALLCPACAHAREIERHGRYRMEIVAGGTVLPVYHHGGMAFVQGRRGERYTIRIHNDSPRRVEVVVAVDGLDVIDGRDASLSKRGYVIGPWSRVDIDGFRLSMDRVAAFRFSDVEDSYAASKGRFWGIGVIAAAVFEEKIRRPRPWPRPLYGRTGKEGSAAESRAAPELAAKPRRFGTRNLGTRFGEPRWSPVSTVDFVRANPSRPSARLAIRYDDREGLCNAGIRAACHAPWPPPWPPPPWPPVHPRPRPQPGPFAEPPPDWEHFESWY